MKKLKKKAVKKEETQGKIVGKTTGLNVKGAWCSVFSQNEKLVKAKRMTDEDISKWIKKEFPERHSAVFDHVRIVRTRYNRGILTGGEVPDQQSRQFDKDGNAVAASSEKSEPAVRTAKKVKKKTAKKVKKAAEEKTETEPEKKSFSPEELHDKYVAQAKKMSVASLSLKLTQIQDRVNSEGGQPEDKYRMKAIKSVIASHKKAKKVKRK